MTTPRKRVAFRQSDLIRAVKAARAADVAVSAVEIAPDGTIRVLTATAPQAPASPFDEWKQKHASAA